MENVTTLGTVGVAELLRVLRPLKATTGKPGLYVPFPRHVLLEPSPDTGGYWLEATDLDVHLRMLASGSVVTEGSSVIVNPRVLFKLLRHWSEDIVTLGLGDSSVGELHLTAAEVHARLVAPLPVEEWQGLQWTPGLACSVPWEPLRRMAGKTMWAASSESSRPILNGVYWQHRGKSGKSEMCGTNGHLLGAQLSDGLAGTDLPDMEAIVPPKFWSVAFRVFGREDHTLTLRKSPEMMSLSSPTAKLTTRLVSGSYPNWRQVMPSENASPVTMIVPKAEFSESVKRALAVAGETAKVLFEVSEERVVLRTFTPDKGEIVEVIQAKLSEWSRYPGGATFCIAADGEYLLKTVRYTSGPELRLHVTEPERAIEFGSDEDEGFRGLVMPLRIPDRRGDRMPVPEGSSDHEPAQT